MSKIQKSEDQWKKELGEDRYRILREKGTEAPGSGTLLHNDKTGEYRCAACNNILFTSDSKYESTMPGLIGWPSFSNVSKSDAVELVPDSSHGMERTEVVCSNCGSHLGHVFPDESSPTDQHYCINSLSLDFKPKSESH